VLGRCDDYYTALGLKGRVYALINQKKVILTNCNNEGDFNALLPLNSTQLIFEADGYKPIVIPVYFAPNVDVKAQFGIWNWGAMTPNDSITVISPFSPGKGSLLSLCYNFVDLLDINYKLNNIRNEEYAKELYSRTKGIKLSNMRVFPMKEGSYVETVTTSDSFLISKEKVNIRIGITFKSVHVVKPIKQDPSNSSILNANIKVSSDSTFYIYFDQSGYELRKQNEDVLDMIAYTMKKNPNIKAKLTGYTDNVGKHELNTTLSEYRAKVVENYLKKRGVLVGQLTTQWKGSDMEISPNALESIKAKARKVVIQFYY